VLPGVVGVIQANEALKIVVGYGEPLVGRLLLFDAQSTTFEELKLKRDPECPTCGKAALDAAPDGRLEANGEPEAVADVAGAACR
jgi:bacteriocin biosynthesis cyclodehydratase domain-containing protein